MFNANNYGYNPYGRYQQPIEQQMVPTQMSLPTRNVLNGKQVDSIEVVKATDIPMDGSISYFPLTDGSGIVTKQLQNDGTSKIKVYKPVNEKQETIKYATIDDLDKKFKSIDLSDIDDLKEEIKDLKKELKDLKKKGVKDE